MANPNIGRTGKYYSGPNKFERKYSDKLAEVPNELGIDFLEESVQTYLANGGEIKKVEIGNEIPVNGWFSDKRKAKEKRN